MLKKRRSLFDAQPTYAWDREQVNGDSGHVISSWRMLSLMNCWTPPLETWQGRFLEGRPWDL